MVELLFFEAGSIVISDSQIDFEYLLLILCNLIRTFGDTEKGKFYYRNVDTEIFWGVAPLFWLHPSPHMSDFGTFSSKTQSLPPKKKQQTNKQKRYG